MSWYRLTNVHEVTSPALLIYPARVEENIRRMIAIAGGAARLRPHMKTHKLAEIIRLQLALGITKFKCATIAETEMVAGCGAPDVLLAYPPVGPNIDRLLELVKFFPSTKFSTIADDAAALRALAHKFADAKLTIEVFLDIDCGMHRSGVEPGPQAIDLYRLIASLPGVIPGGLHVYDGHIHDHDLATRTAVCEAAFAPANALCQQLLQAGLPVPRVVAGGTPTFPIHAQRPDVECSPGTCVLWDAGYGTMVPDLDFLHAAMLLTRVVSKPGGNRLCLDLGHKAVAAENPHPRVQFPDLPDAKAVTHSEEHLVIETARAPEYAVGDCLYGIPWHICPTVALHSEAFVVQEGQAVTRWKITARARRLTI